MTSRRLLTAISLGFVLTLSCAAMGQSAGKNKKKIDSPGEPIAEANREPDRNILAGPEVEGEAEVGRGSMMAAPNNVGRQRGGNNDGVPFRQWMDVVRTIDLAPEQQEKIVAIAGEFQSAQRQFQREYGEQMRQLQQQVREARENGKNPPEGVREQYQKLDAASPKPIEYQQRVWEELTAEQQATVRTKLAEIEQRRAAQKAGPGMISTSGVRSAGGGSSGGGSGGGARNDPKQDSTEGMGATSGESQRARPSAEKPMSDDGAPSATVRERGRARQRGESADARSMTGLDTRAQKRLRFLLQHQSSDLAGNAPTSSEKSFTFKEDGET